MAHRYLLRTARDDLNSLFSTRTLSIQIEDIEDLQEDFLCIEALDDKVIRLPEIGEKIEASLGIEGDLITVGTYFLKEIEVNQERLVFKCSALPKGLNQYREKAFRSEKLVDLLTEIADGEDLTVSLDEDLKELEITDFQKETNGSFLSRIGKNIGCSVKTCDGKIVFSKGDKGKSTDGKDLPEVTIQNLLDVNYTKKEEKTYTGVRTYYWSEKEKKPIYHVEGTNENFLDIRYNLVTKLASERKAKAKFKEIQKGSTSLEFTCFSSQNFNTARLVCGAPVRLPSFRTGIPEEWIIRKVSHQLSPEGLLAKVEGVKI
jgi:hypothetical protein